MLSETFFNLDLISNTFLYDYKLFFKGMFMSNDYIHWWTDLAGHNAFRGMREDLPTTPSFQLY